MWAAERRASTLPYRGRPLLPLEVPPDLDYDDEEETDAEASPTNAIEWDAILEQRRRPIGSGTQGGVSVVTVPGWGDVAMKTTRMAHTSEFKREVRVLTEMQTLKGAREFVVEMLGYTTTRDGLHHMLLRLATGSFATFNVVQKRVRVNDRLLQAFARIRAALAFLHGHGFLHRDVKPDNILILGDDRPVLSDFGLSVQQDDADVCEQVGTKMYMSPASLQGRCDEPKARKDTWAVGVMMLQALCGNYAHLPMTKRSARGRFVCGRFDNDYFVLLAWVQGLRSRLEAHQVFHHPSRTELWQQAKQICLPQLEDVSRAPSYRGEKRKRSDKTSYCSDFDIMVLQEGLRNW